jgi:hypothetical protein
MRTAPATRRPWLRALLGAALALHLAGCGTLLYPERHGLRGGRVDPAVVLLDGALLFLFIVPGLVAYGIDFHTGAIYLPGGGGRVTVVPAPDGDTGDAAVRELLLRHTGVALPPDARPRALPCPDAETLAYWLSAATQPGADPAMLGALSSRG